MVLKSWLNETTKKLESSGISTSRLDCLILLEDELSKDRSWILAHQETELSESQIKKLNSKIAKRARHVPLAYIRQKTEFYGREFYINKDVLEPRPESETMLEMLRHLVDSRQFTVDSQTTVADIGTGSGAIGITAKLEFPEAKVFAIDIDENCLKVARKNADQLNSNIELIKGDLLQPLLSTNYQLLSTILLCNLPYVPDTYTINEAAMFEPKIAIFGGSDGLDLYRNLFKQIDEIEQIKKPKCIFTESLPPQHKELAKIAKASNYKQIEKQDFIQIFQYQD